VPCFGIFLWILIINNIIILKNGERVVRMQKLEISKEIKKKVKEEIIRYFAIERDEDIGELSAELFLDFITEKIGPVFYNQGVRDAQAFLSEKLEDLYGIEKQIKF
jgi:uncharacterized protein (DUF2164 family)